MIIGQFVLNQDYIAQELCENKEEPELECNGKCYLSKELKKDGERKNDEKTSKVEVLLFCDCKIESFELLNKIEVEKSEFSNYSAKLTNGFESGVFHPPC